MTFRQLKLHKDPNCPICGENPTIKELIDYEEFCGLKGPVGEKPALEEITATELKSLFDRGEDFQLIDVREEHEVDIASIGGELIPMGGVMDNLDKISKDKKVVVYCRSGKRSGAIVQALEQSGFTNIHNLKGGILDWIDKVDPSQPKY